MHRAICVDDCATANITVDRWGGDSLSVYNYQLDVTSSIADWFFETQGGTAAMPGRVVTESRHSTRCPRQQHQREKLWGQCPCSAGWQGQHLMQLPRVHLPRPAESGYRARMRQRHISQCFNGCTNSNGCNNRQQSWRNSVSEPAPTPPAASAVTTAWADELGLEAGPAIWSTSSAPETRQPAQAPA